MVVVPQETEVAEIVAGGFELTRRDDIPSNNKNGEAPKLIIPGNEPIPNIQPPVPLQPKRTGN